MNECIFPSMNHYVAFIENRAATELQQSCNRAATDYVALTVNLPLGTDEGLINECINK
jgi:hypothetical protein